MILFEKKVYHKIEIISILEHPYYNLESTLLSVGDSLAGAHTFLKLKVFLLRFRIIFPIVGFLSVLQIFFINAVDVSPQESPLSAPPRYGIPETSAKSSDCFFPGEMDQHLSFINSNVNTMQLPSCKVRFIKPIAVIKDNISYVPGTGGSVYHCHKYRIHQYHAKFLAEALNQITSYADTQLQSTDAVTRGEANKCLANVFYQWAKVDALGKLEGEDQQVQYSQMWNTGGLATVYLKYPSIGVTAKTLYSGSITYESSIKQWFTRMGSRVYAQVLKVKTSPYGVNNMFYWRAYSLMATALISHNNEHIKASRDLFLKALSSITNGGVTASPQDKGYLPGELMRRSRALAYHEMALRPLLGMINLSDAMDCSFLKTDQQIWSIALLIRKVIEGHYYPEVFQTASYCLLNGGCQTQNGPITFAELRQTADGNAEQLLVLLGQGDAAQLVLQRMESYLRTRGIRYVKTFTNNNLFKDRFLGGDIRLAPAAGSIAYPEKSAMDFCQ